MTKFRIPRVVAVSFVVLAIFAGWTPIAHGGKFNKKLSVGDAAPSWSGLAGIDDREHSLEDYKESTILVLVFTCNHCPVAQAYEDAIQTLAKDYKDRGVTVVGICSSRHPADTLAKMKVRAQEHEYEISYVLDATQQVAKEYGARVTPEFVVLNRDRKIAYLGAMDDGRSSPTKAKRPFIREALDAILADKTPPHIETRPSGCEIRYEED